MQQNNSAKRFAYDRKAGVFRAYLGDAIIPICQHCDNRRGCDFKKDDLYGCNSFTNPIRSRDEIRVRLTETIGEIRRMDGKSELIDFQSAEEWEVYDALVAERDILMWVLDGGRS
jgi:hypothetical protein